MKRVDWTIDWTRIGGIRRDPAFQMAIGHVALAVMFAFVAASKPQFRYLFLLVPVALACAGVMAWMFVHSTDMIVVYDDKEMTTQQLEHARQRHDEELARRVHDIIAGLGLIQSDFSIGGGRVVHIPEMVSVVAGPPVGLHIRLLPGQTPDDFAAHAPAIAYNLDVTEVRVVPLEPSLIRLDLLLVSPVGEIRHWLPEDHLKIYTDRANGTKADRPQWTRRGAARR